MKSFAVMLVIALGGAACSGGAERTDSTTILPVDDINARDTTPTPEPPRVSRLTLMDSVPAGGLCTVRRYRAGADQAREVSYETNTPSRTYVIEVGKQTRQFLPVSMDIRGTQVGPDLTETENVFVGFTAGGAVSVGTRRYSATGNTTVNDREPLQSGDSAKALEFVRKILSMCDAGR